MSATYRRRVEGRGRRSSGRRKSGGAGTQSRCLAQLAASLLLFLLVFGARGLFPAQAGALGETLRANSDFSGAVTAFRAAISKGESFQTAAQAFWDRAMGRTRGNERDAARPGGDGPMDETLPKLPDYASRMTRPDWPRQGTENEEDTQPGPTSSAPPVSPEPAVVTAVAQTHNEAGEALPKNVSLEFYELGLARVAVPVSGKVTSPFGFRDHPVSGAYSFHTALDIGVDKGTDVLAYADGTVRYVGENSIFGLYVKVDHANGVSTFYAHCSKLLVSKGDEVKCGQVIAKSGDTGNATGPHLHFSIEKDGVRLNPAYYLEL